MLDVRYPQCMGEMLRFFSSMATGRESHESHSLIVALSPATWYERSFAFVVVVVILRVALFVLS